MKKLIFLLFPLVVFAKSYLISNIPLPKTYIQNLDPYPCDQYCLQEYLNKDMIFSFLSHADAKLENEEQDQIRMMNISILNLGSPVITDKIKIALLLPYKTIGKYASSTTNAAFAYLIAKNRSFELKSYKIESESAEDIKEAISKIQRDGFSYIIAPLTQTGADAISIINPKINIYFPTIHKNETLNTQSSLYYGGIDYKAQSDLLLKEAVSPLVIFYDESSIGKRLSMYEENTFKNTSEPKMVKVLDAEKKVIKFSIPKRITNLEHQLKENEDINRGSFFINTPIVKTGMIMSQLTLYDANATNILSTQINYDPLLLSMTQYDDRKNMIVANSITKHNDVLTETNSLLNNDIVYDWINYTTTVGVDYFYNLITKESQEYDIQMIDNQMIYNIELLKPSLSRFIKYVAIPSKTTKE
jgi:SRSO17 transposase